MKAGSMYTIVKWHTADAMACIIGSEKGFATMAVELLLNRV